MSFQNSHRPVRRIAVSRLHLPDGRICRHQVLEFAENSDIPIRYYPLEGEPAFTEWRGGDYYWR